MFFKRRCPEVHRNKSIDFSIEFPGKKGSTVIGVARGPWVKRDFTVSIGGKNQAFTLREL